MNELIKTAVEVFADCERFWGEDGKWVAQHIGPVMEHFYDLPVGEEISFHKHIEETYGQDRVPTAMGNMMPYITGPYGVLDISFQTADGVKVDPKNWQMVKELGKENIKCFAEDGRELSQNEVFVIFRRNARMELDRPA